MLFLKKYKYNDNNLAICYYRFSSHAQNEASIDQQREQAKFFAQTHIVFGRKGSVDRHCLIRKDQEGWMQGSDCIRVRILDDSVYPEFVSYYLLTNAVKMKINNSAVGSTMASLNTDILGDIDIHLPDYIEQKRIALILGTIDKKISKNNMINDYLAYQFSMVA